MPEDTSQTPPPANASEVNTQTPANPSAAVAPAETTPPQSQPQSNADALAQSQHDGKTGEGGVKSEYDDYESERIALLGSPSAAAAPAAPVSQPPVAQTLEEENDLSDITTATEEDGRMKPIKLRPADAEERQMMSEFKAAKQTGYPHGYTKFAVDRALAQRPAAPAAAAPVVEPVAPVEPAEESAPQFQSMDEVHAEIRRLRAEKVALQEAFDFKAAGDLESKADALLMKLPELAAEFEAQAQAYKSEWQASQAKAKSLFPDAGVEGSALEIAAAQVRDDWVANQHPLAFVNDSAVALYAEAAAKIGIQPGPSTRPTPTPSVTPPSPVHRPALSPILSGSGAPAQPPQPPVDVSQTPLSDYEKERAKLLGKEFRGHQFAS